MAVGKDKSRLTITLENIVHEEIVKICKEQNLSISKFLNKIARKELNIDNKEVK